MSQQLQEELSLLMVRASLKGKFGMNEMAEKNGITLTQALTLCLVDAEQPTSMSSLSTFLSCDPSSVTANVDRLVTGAFIERKESTHDRRIKVLTLTSKGMELRRALLQVAAEKRLPNFAAMNAEEVGQLIALLKKATTI